MTAERPTAAALAARAADELAQGLSTAWVPALVAIALALTGKPDPGVANCGCCGHPRDASDYWCTHEGCVCSKSHQRARS